MKHEDLKLLTAKHSEIISGFREFSIWFVPNCSGGDFIVPGQEKQMFSKNYEVKTHILESVK